MTSRPSTHPTTFAGCTLSCTAAIAAVLAPTAALGEDLFALLEPDAAAACTTDAAAEAPVSAPTGIPNSKASREAKGPTPAKPAAGTPEVTPLQFNESAADRSKAPEQDAAEQMIAALVEAIPVEAPAAPRLVFVSDEAPLYPCDDSEWVPSPYPAAQLVPSEVPTLAEPLVPSPASTVATPETALTRSILGVTLDASAAPALVDQLVELEGPFAIKDVAVDRFGAWDAPAREATLTPPRFAGTLKSFAAPAVFSRPLYFEQPNLERYGHHVAFCDHDHLTQSALSAAHFFATVPVLPYKMGANRPDDCNYVLGTYRPGSCNPHELVKPELSVGGSVVEGAAVAGLIFLIP